MRPRLLGWLLIAAGALVLLAPLTARQLRVLGQKRMVATFPVVAPAPSPVVASPPEPEEPPEPEPAAEPLPQQGYLIDMPKLSVRYLVMPGIENEDLDRGPGHYPATAQPGEAGNAAIAGHRTVRGLPSYFYHLDWLAPGDTIRITYPDHTLTYIVERVFTTSPYDLSVLEPTPHPALTLTTCDPPGSDDQRLIVRARLAP